MLHGFHHGGMTNDQSGNGALARARIRDPIQPLLHDGGRLQERGREDQRRGAGCQQAGGYPERRFLAVRLAGEPQEGRYPHRL
ncbi:hypothetical protein D3C80_1961870 [compost metagenome]